MAMSAEHVGHLKLLIGNGMVYLHMSEKFSSGTKTPKQTIPDTLDPIRHDPHRRYYQSFTHRSRERKSIFYRCSLYF